MVDYFKSTLATDTYNTIGGLLANTFGRIPNQGESIEIDGFRFEVLRADSRRIHLLKLIIG